jgi:hypothetical protein
MRAQVAGGIIETGKPNRGRRRRLYILLNNGMMPIVIEIFTSH